MYNKLNNKLIIFIFFLPLLWFYTVTLYDSVKNKKLEWDEVDYVSAAQKGFSNNYWETNTLNFKDFLTLGYLKVKGDKNEIIDFSNNKINEADDLFNLKHFHHNLPFYYWSFFVDENIGKIEKNLILSQFLILFIILTICYFFSKNIKSKFIIIFSLSILLTTEIFLKSFTEINTHFFSTIFYLLILYFFQHYNDNKYENKNILIFSLLISLTFLSSETSYLLILFVFYFIYKNVDLNIKKFNFFLKLFLLVFFFIIIFSPGTLTNLSPLKTLIIHFYRFFLNSSNEFSNLTITENLLLLFNNNIEYFILAITLNLFFLINFNKQSLYNKTFWIFSIVYFVIMLRLMINESYIFPPIILNLIICLKFIENIIPKKKLSYVAIFGFFLILFSSSAFNYKEKIFKLKISINKKTQDLNFTQKILNKNKDKNFLIDSGHVFKFYNKHANINNLNYDNLSDLNLYIRKNYIYYKIDYNYISQNFDFIFLKNRKNINKVVSKLIENNYKVLKLNNNFIYLKKT